MTTRPISNTSSVIQPTWINQVARFLLVGVFNTLLDGALYFALTRWLGFNTVRVLAKGISYSVGILNSYYWNKRWTFKLAAPGNWRVFLSFVLVNLISLALNAAVMYTCLSILAWPDAPAWLAAAGVAFVWNFLVSKFLVFKR